MKLRQQIRTLLLVFLKHTLNPLTRKLARSSFGAFAAVQHVGRRSGRAYETPILVGAADDGFVIELTYGPEVDWYKNVLAAGGCNLVWHGKTYVIDRIEALDAETGRAAYALPARILLRITNKQHFAKMVVQR